MQRQFSEFSVSQRERKMPGLTENSSFDMHLARRLSTTISYNDIRRLRMPKSLQGKQLNHFLAAYFYELVLYNFIVLYIIILINIY